MDLGQENRRQGEALQYSPFSVRNCCTNYLKNQHNGKLILFFSKKTKKKVVDIANDLRDQAKLRATEDNPNPSEEALLERMGEIISTLSQCNLSDSEAIFLTQLTELYESGNTLHQEQLKMQSTYKKEGPDYNQLLGVDRQESNDKILQAYKKEARLQHPDKGGDHDHMSKLTKAKAILLEPEKRKEYDAALAKYEKEIGGTTYYMHP